MLKKTITWTDFNGDKHTEDFYFHLSKSELANLQLTYRGGMQEFLKRIVADNDGEQIMTTFKKILEMSFGERSEDGKYFFKTPEAWMKFYSSGAYDEFFMELVTDANAGAEFIRRVVPQNLGAQIPEQVKQLENAALPPEVEKDWTDYTMEELVTMDSAQFDKMLKKHGHNVPRGLMAVAMGRRSVGKDS